MVMLILTGLKRVVSGAALRFGSQCNATLDNFFFSLSNHRDEGLISAQLPSEGLAQCIQKSNSLASFS